MTEEITRMYTIPLRKRYAETPRHNRTNKAVRVLKEFIVKHMKSENIKIGVKLNELMWKNGIKNPPSKVKVTAIKDKEGVVRVELEGVEYVDFKVQEKVDKNQSFKEKLQNKVQTAKDDGKTKDNKKNTVKVKSLEESIEAKPATKTTKQKVEEKAKTEKPVVTKVEEKPVKQEPKAEVKSEAKVETITKEKEDVSTENKKTE